MTDVQEMTDAKKRIDYIKSLEIAEPSDQIRELDLSGAAAAEDHDGEASGYVADGSLVSFVSDVGTQAQQDVLNSTLLAQLAANKKYDRFEDTENWYKMYVEVLGKIGWVIESFDFQKYSKSGDTVRVQDVVIKLLGAIATQNGMAIFGETLEALEALSDDDGRLVLFDSQGEDLGKGNFQAGIANETNGVVSFSVGAFHFTSEEHTTRFLWFGYSSTRMKLFQSNQQATLNESVYDQVRKAVIDKLGDSAETYIGDLEI